MFLGVYGVCGRAWCIMDRTGLKGLYPIFVFSGFHRAHCMSLLCCTHACSVFFGPFSGRLFSDSIFSVLGAFGASLPRRFDEHERMAGRDGSKGPCSWYSQQCVCSCRPNVVTAPMVVSLILCSWCFFGAHFGLAEPALSLVGPSNHPDRSVASLA